MKKDEDQLETEIRRAAEALSRATRVAVLTGAGVSAESGVPTFRASDGLWEGHRIEDVASPTGSTATRDWSGTFTTPVGPTWSASGRIRDTWPWPTLSAGSGTGSRWPHRTWTGCTRPRDAATCWKST